MRVRITRFLTLTARTLTLEPDPSLVKKLVEETTKVVRPNLKHLWISAQRVIADKKREGKGRMLSLYYLLSRGDTTANV